MTQDLRDVPHAYELAALASAAAFVDSGLLRHLRLRFLPDADARAEACVWWSDIVESRGNNGLTFAPEALDALRDTLEQRAHARSVIEAIAAYHDGGPPLLALEERLIALDVVERSPAKIEACLAAALAELDRERADEVLAWAERALPRFPRRARSSTAAWILSLAVSKRFRVPLVLVPEQPPAVEWARVARWLPDRDHDVGVAIELDRGEVFAVDAGAAAQPVSVPPTDPLVVLVERGEHHESIQIPRGGRARLGGATEALTIANLRGERWAVHPGEREDRAGIQTEPARTFRWLHLGDLLTRDRPPFDPVRLGRDLADAGPIDAVIVAGDLTFSAAPAELDLVRDALGELLSELSRAGAAPKLFAVPGNHDVGRPLMVAFTGDLDVPGNLDVPNLDVPRLQRWHKDAAMRDEFWARRGSLWDACQAALAPWRERAFPGGYGLLPGDFASSFTSKGLRVGVVGLNSVFLRVIDARSRDDLDPRQLAAVCPEGVDAWVATHDLRILVTHHPIGALHPRARAEFESQIAPPGRFHLHFCSGALAQGAHRSAHALVMMRQTGFAYDQDGSGACSVGELVARGPAATVAVAEWTWSPDRRVAMRGAPQRYDLDLGGEVAAGPVVGGAAAADTGVWVLVDGDDHAELPHEQRETARCLGESLARAGHSLITFGRPGVAYAVAEGFMHVLRAHGYTSGTYRLMHILLDGTKAFFKDGGRAICPAPGETISDAALARAHAVVLIGDPSLSRERLARLRDQKPVVSLTDELIYGGGLALPPLWKWKTHRDSTAHTTRAISELVRVGPPSEGTPLGLLVHEAAIVLDRREPADFEAGLDELAGKVEALPAGVMERLFGDARPSHRLVGYLTWRVLAPAVDELLAAAKAELATLRQQWETRTVWMVVEAARRIPVKPDEARLRALAAALVVLQREYARLLPPDPSQPVQTFTRIEQELINQHSDFRTAAVHARWLAEQADAYEELRKTPAGSVRTSAMDQLVFDFIQALRDEEVAPLEAELWCRGSHGPRIVALVLLRAARDPRRYSIVEEMIRSPLSPFEQFHALAAADAIVERLSPAERDQLEGAINRQRGGPPGIIDRTDRSRWELSGQILTKIEQLRQTQSPRCWVLLFSAAGEAPGQLTTEAPREAQPGDIVAVFSRAVSWPVGIYSIGKSRKTRPKGKGVTTVASLLLALPRTVSRQGAHSAQMQTVLDRVSARQSRWAESDGSTLLDLFEELYAGDAALLVQIRQIYKVGRATD